MKRGVRAWTCYWLLVTIVIKGHRIDLKMMEQLACFCDFRRELLRDHGLHDMVRDLRSSGAPAGSAAAAGPCKKLVGCLIELGWDWVDTMIFRNDIGILIDLDHDPSAWICHQIRESQRIFSGRKSRRHVWDVRACRWPNSA